MVKINKNAISYLAIKKCFTRFLSNYFFCRPPPRPPPRPPRPPRPPPASLLFLALVALVVLEAPVSFVSFAPRDFIIAEEEELDKNGKRGECGATTEKLS